MLSTGRAGTSFLHRAFDRLDLGVTLSHQSRGSRRLNIAGNLLYDCKNGPDYMRVLFRLLKGTQVPSSTTDPLLSIPIAIFLNKKSVYSKFPHKIIHLVRDPRDFVASFMNWRRQRLRRMFLHHVVPFWQPSPFLFPGHSAFSRLGMSKFGHYCWIWNFKNSFFRHQFENGPAYFLLRSEDLFSPDKGEEAFERLLTFIGCSHGIDSFEDLSASQVNASKLKGFPKWQRWSQTQARTLHKHCGALMVHYGYGNEPFWLKLLG